MVEEQVKGDRGTGQRLKLTNLRASEEVTATDRVEDEENSVLTGPAWLCRTWGRCIMAWLTKLGSLLGGREDWMKRWSCGVILVLLIWDI